MPLSLKAGKCCCCKDGAVIPKWLNLTKVRATDDTLPATYDCAPYLRYDTTQYEQDNGLGACAGLTTGCEKCGYWIIGGDKNGLSAQEVTDTVNDIMTCAATETPPAEIVHVTSDHNCYQKSGTVDMRQTERKGGQWILALKNWHGRFPFKTVNANNESCDGINPSQVRYRKIKRRVQMSITNSAETGGAVDGYAWPDGLDACTGAKIGFDGKTVIQWAQTVAATFEVDPLSGVITASEVERNPASYSGTYEVTNAIYSGNVRPHSESGTLILNDLLIPSDPLGTDWVRVKTVCPDDPSYPATVNTTIVNGINTTAATNLRSLFQDSWLPVLLRLDSVCEQLLTHHGESHPWFIYDNWQDLMDYIPTQTATPNPAGGYFYFTVVSQTYSDTKMEFEAVSSAKTDVPTSGDGYYVDFKARFKVTIELSEPYTAEQVYQTWLGMFREFDMSDFSLAHLREDEKLALALLIVCDEKPFVVNPDKMLFDGVPDYETGEGPDSEGRNPGDPGYVPTQALRDWFDPDAFKWIYSTGSVNTSNPDGNGIVSGATLHGPGYTGEIIAHNQAGSERHFWFNFNEWERVPDPATGCADNFIWNLAGRGAFSPTELPAVALRWMDRATAQYDTGPFCSLTTTPHAANFPQAFINQGKGQIWGAKYVEPAFEWPSVNYGRPCGPDRYAVDQTTVCTITSGTPGSGTITVKKTQNATAPLDTGGLAVGHYIASTTGGTYKITGITDNLDGTFELTLDAKIDDLPTGWQMAVRDDAGGLGVPAADYVGKLRWVSYVRNGSTISMPSPICGRAACTTSETGGTVTVTFGDAQPYIRKDVTDGKIIVDLWNAAHTVKVASAVELTRVSDTVFTYAAGANPNAAWATGKDYVWTDYDEKPKHMGVKNDWKFDNRKAQTGYTGTVPEWYDGMPGCLENGKAEFTYNLGKCRAMVGFVPHYSPLADTSNDLPDQNSQPPANEPIEDFTNQVLFDFPATFTFDDLYGAHWQGEVAMVMVDPFWQAPFVPDGGLEEGEAMKLIEDDGSGHESYQDTVDGTLWYYVYYPHRRWVEAAIDIPTGKHLPDVLSLTYSHAIRPINGSTTFYNVVDGGMFNGGIKIGDKDGNYASLETVYGFRNRACATISGMGNFYEVYQEFVPC